VRENLLSKGKLMDEEIVRLKAEEEFYLPE
jgi:hypothetical protein